MRGSRPRMRGCSAAHSAQWHDLELWFRRLLQHGNMRERKERVVYASLRPTKTFMHACLRPTEAAHFRVQKCANNHQLIVADIQRFLQHACTFSHIAQLTSVTYKHAKRCVRYVYIRKHWLAYFSYTETITCMRFFHEDEICFTSMDAIFKRS